MATKTDAAIEMSGQPATEEHVVIFRLADEFYALDIQTVQEIVRMQTITSIPGSDFWVEGITNLRGRVVPVIDLRKRCGVDAGEYSAETRIVVVSSAGGMVGLIGTLLGKDGVNIADMSLSRLTPGGTAYMVVRVDTEPSENARKEIKGNPAIKMAKFVQL